MTNFAGMGFIGGAGLAQFAYNGNRSNQSNNDTYVWNNVNLSPILGVRRILALFYANSGGASRNANSATCGSVSMTKLGEIDDGDTTTAMFICNYPANLGDIANIGVVWSGNQARCGNHIYSLNRGLTTLYSDTDPLSISGIVVPANSIVIGGGCAKGGTISASWTGLTELDESQVDLTLTYTTAADRFSTANPSLTVSAAINGNNDNMLVGVFSQL